MKSYEFRLEATPTESNPYRDVVDSYSVVLLVSAEDEADAINVADACLLENGLACTDEEKLCSPVLKGDSPGCGGVMIHFTMRMKPGVDVSNDPRFQEGSFGPIFE